MSDLLFFPFSKIDEALRLVYGRAAQEVPDRTRPIPELMDYALSKPHFEKWSAEQEEASGGKSYGNLRAMHQKIAAGILAQPLIFDDAEKAIDIVSKVTDDTEWGKCLDGTYTGFSVGGNYAPDTKRVELVDGVRVMRYAAMPNEISLADRPQIPGSTFRLVKVDGTEEDRPFARRTGEMGDGRWEMGEKTASLSPLQSPIDLSKVAARPDVKPSEGTSKYGDVTFADAKNKKYPIDTEAHIRAAWNYINKPKNAAKYPAADVKSIKAKIVSAWKSKIDKDGPPSAKEDTVTKVAKVDCYDGAMDVLNKWAGEEISDVSSAVSALMSIVWLYTKEQQESHPEAEAQIKALAAAITALKEFIVSEIQEKDEDDVINLAAKIGDLEKIDAGQLAKVGASISGENMKKIQAIHDHSAALGADCGGAEKTARSGELQKIAGERDGALQKIALVTGERDGALQKVAALEATQGRLEKVVTAALSLNPAEPFDLAKIEALPAPAKGALRETIAVTKVGDAGTLDAAGEQQFAKVAELAKTGHAEAAASQLIKMIHAGGPRMPAAR